MSNPITKIEIGLYFLIFTLVVFMGKINSISILSTEGALKQASLFLFSALFLRMSIWDIRFRLVPSWQILVLFLISFLFTDKQISDAFIDSLIVCGGIVVLNFFIEPYIMWRYKDIENHEELKLIADGDILPLAALAVLFSGSILASAVVFSILTLSLVHIFILLLGASYSTILKRKKIKPIWKIEDLKIRKSTEGKKLDSSSVEIAFIPSIAFSFLVHYFFNFDLFEIFEVSHLVGF